MYNKGGLNTDKMFDNIVKLLFGGVVIDIVLMLKREVLFLKNIHKHTYHAQIFL